MNATQLISRLRPMQDAFIESLSCGTASALAHYVYQKFGDKAIATVNKSVPRLPGLFLIAHTGGASGGNCWGDEAEEYSTGEICDVRTIYDWLAQAGIVFSDTEKTLMDATLVRDTTGDTGGEWYGNYECYDVAYVSIDALVATLIFQGKLDYE